MDAVTIRIPGVPRGKGRPRFTRTGSVFTPKETEERERVVRAYALEALRAAGVLEPWDVPVSVVVTAVCPVPVSWSKKKTAAALAGEIVPTARPDLDNVVKLVLDAMNKVAFTDDSRIVTMAAAKRFGPKPMTVIVIRPVEVAP